MKERIDNTKARTRHRTSLSTPISDQEMCDVAKVHALWVPPQKLAGQLYDCEFSLRDNNLSYSAISSGTLSPIQRVIHLASMLGLRPVGWVYTYEPIPGDDRETSEVPILGRDAVVAGWIQSFIMETVGREEGNAFVTLAMEAPTGATEAFQISDTCVQMAAEGVLILPEDMEEFSASSRYVKTSDPIMVNGGEMQEVDTLLFLINTAMLGHTGLYAGSGDTRSTGKILVKTKKKLISALQQQSSLSKEDSKHPALEILCDFNLLFGLSNLLSTDDMEKLCILVSGYAKGMKKGTRLSDKLRTAIETALGG